MTGMDGNETVERKWSLMIHYYLLLNGKIDNLNPLSRCGLSVSNQYAQLHSVACCLYRQCAHALHSLHTCRALTAVNVVIAQQPKVNIFHNELREFSKLCYDLLPNKHFNLI